VHGQHSDRLSHRAALQEPARDPRGGPVDVAVAEPLALHFERDGVP
jgi:hypothetical protein